MTTQYAWSWNTVAAIGIGAALYWSFRYLLRRRYTKEYESLRKDAEALASQAPRFWEKGVIDRESYSYERALNWWLWSFQFLQSEALSLKVLCVAVQASTLVAAYFVFAEPIYFESSLP